MEVQTHVFLTSGIGVGSQLHGRPTYTLQTVLYEQSCCLIRLTLTVPYGQSVTSHFYVQVLQRLRNAVRGFCFGGSRFILTYSIASHSTCHENAH
jgi:hypothetical protein